MELLPLDPDRRAEELDRIGREDPSLRQRLEKLLTAHDRAGDFLEAPVRAASELRPEAASLPIGTVIDRFKLLELIGEGGFRPGQAAILRGNDRNGSGRSAGDFHLHRRTALGLCPGLAVRPAAWR